MYLVYNDYKLSIQNENLQQIISQDDTIRIYAENAAKEEVISYLIQKFDVDEEFKDTNKFSFSTIYKAGETIQLSATTYSATTLYQVNDLIEYSGLVYSSNVQQSGVTPSSASYSLLGSQYQLFNAIIPEDRFLFTTEYNAGDKVFWRNSVYTALKQNIGVYPDDTSIGDQYWSGTTYSFSGQTITNTTYFTPGDARSAQMVMCVIDITLYNIHSRVSPRNMPELRVKRRDDAIKWLKDSSFGYITPNLQTITPRSGCRWRIGSEPKNINTY